MKMEKTFSVIFFVLLFCISGFVRAQNITITNRISASNISVTGRVDASSFSGTISTASQPNITLLGGLAAITVSGSAVVTGNVLAGNLSTVSAGSILGGSGGINTAGTITANGTITSASSMLADVFSTTAAGSITAGSGGASVDGPFTVTGTTTLNTVQIAGRGDAPTPDFGDNSTMIATTAYINSREMVRVLTANEAGTTSTTTAEITGLTVSGLSAGTYVFDYYVRYQNNNANGGIRVALNYTGTVTAINYRFEHGTSGTTTATNITDNESTTAAGQMQEALNTGTNNTNLVTAGVATANSPMFGVVRGLLIAGGTGNLQFKFAAEANTATLLQGTALVLRRVN
jgi:hypothetical protein